MASTLLRVPLLGRGISTFALLDARELEFYRAHSRSLASVPALAKARIEPDGALVIPLSAHC